MYKSIGIWLLDCWLQKEEKEEAVGYVPLIPKPPQRHTRKLNRSHAIGIILHPRGVVVRFFSPSSTMLRSLRWSIPRLERRRPHGVDYEHGENMLNVDGYMEQRLDCSDT